MGDEWSLLRRAVGSQRLDLVRKHAARGPQPCKPGGDPWDPPLAHAVLIARDTVGEAIVQALLDAGHRPDARSTGGEPALHVACVHSRVGLSLARRLAEAGADLEARDASGRTALLAVVELLARDADPEGVAIVVALLALGASVDARDEQHGTSLHAAVSKGNDHIELVDTLLAWGADPNALDEAGCSPWSRLRQVVGPARAATMAVGRALRAAGARDASTAEDARDRVVALLTRVKRGKSAARSDNYMGDAAARGDLAAVQEWLDDGADPDEPRRDGWYPIQRAKLDQREEVIALLLSRGARDRDPLPVAPERLEAASALGEAFRTLMALVEDSGPATVEELPDEERERGVAEAAALIAAGALGDQPYAVRVAGEPILEVAVDENQVPVVTALLGYGAPPAASGCASLRTAARNGSTEVVAALLRAGVDPSARSGDGDDDTALIGAARYGRADVVRILLDAGADPFARLPGGNTAINLAAGPRQQRIRALIRSASARRSPKPRGASVRYVGDPLKDLVTQRGAWRYARRGGHRRGPFALLLRHDDVAVVARAHAQMRGHVALFTDALEQPVAWAPRFDVVFRLHGHPWCVVLLDELPTKAARDASIDEATRLARTLGTSAVWVSADDPRGSSLQVEVEARAFGTARDADVLCCTAGAHGEDHVVDPWFAAHDAFLPACELGVDPWCCTVGISGIRKRDLAGVAVMVVEADPWPSRLAAK